MKHVPDALGNGHLYSGKLKAGTDGIATPDIKKSGMHYISNLCAGLREDIELASLPPGNCCWFRFYL